MTALRATLLALLVLAALPALALAHHSSDSVDPRCAEWRQNGAPAGIDLSVVCVANQVVGTYTASSTDDPDLLPYAGAALAFGVVMAGVGVVGLRLTAKPVAKRLAPVTPDAWWVCPGCRSLNAAERAACYACRTDAPAGTGAPLMPTATAPTIDQRTSVRTT